MDLITNEVNELVYRLKRIQPYTPAPTSPSASSNTISTLSKPCQSSKSSFKSKSVEEILTKLTNYFESNSDSLTLQERAQLFYLSGKIHNVETGHSMKAEESLIQAIKLDPKNGDAWNELGESFWKKQDLLSARNCFLSSLSFQPSSKHSLRELSKLLRALGQKSRYSAEESQVLVAESVDRAKQAVNLDVNDGESWQTLGNAYTMCFFGPKKLNSTNVMLKKAIKAYNRARAHISTVENESDLYINRGVVLKYLERYQESLDSLETAIIKESDSTSSISHYAQEKVSQIKTLLKKIREVNAKKVGMRVSKINSSISSTASTTTTTTNEQENSICVNALQLGANRGALTGRVLSVFNTNDAPIYYSFVDRNGSVIPVSLYSEVHVKPSDQVLILNPTKLEVAPSLFILHIDSPNQFLVNGMNPKP